MKTLQLMWHKYRYFPYEYEFAKREVTALFGQAPRPVKGGLEVILDGHNPELSKRLTYFSEVRLPDGSRVVPEQCLLENSAHSSAKSAVNREGDARAVSLTRQRTRYSAHGLHEYKGKFNPQVVRAVGNMLRLERGAWVLDPFCGSGTTLLEAAHIGWNAIGLDLNPLAVVISNAKIRAMRISERVLQGYVDRLAAALKAKVEGMQFDRAWTDEEVNRVGGANWADRLPNFEYLSRWFPASVLVQFSLILGEIERTVKRSDQLVFQVILSDLTRLVSYQDPGDLRIRRRKDARENYPVIEMFVRAMVGKVRAVLEARKVLPETAGTLAAYVADARKPLLWLQRKLRRKGLDRFNAIVTSPPYATALPYIDTQRLSLSLLGLVDANKISELDRELIGSRELAERERVALENQLQLRSSNSLPESVLRLCAIMLDLAKKDGNGFRRRNTPALVYRYFSDMAQVLHNVAEVTGPGSSLALGGGRNRTTLGGESVLIDTPVLLADVAARAGWRLIDIVEMNTYHRFDIHSRNSIRAESLVLMERA